MCSLCTAQRFKKTKRLRHNERQIICLFFYWYLPFTLRDLFRFLLVFLSAMLRDAHKIYLLCTSIHVSVRAVIQAFALSLRRFFISSCSFHLMLIAVMFAGRLSLPSIPQALGFIAFLVVVAFGVIHQVFVSFQLCLFRALLKRKSPT